MRSLLIGVALAGIAAAQEPPVEKTGKGVTQPQLLSKVEPAYSEEARKAKLQGTVELQAVIGTNGAPRDFKITRSLGLGLDDEATRAVGRWRFSPGLKSGAPVPVIVTVQVSFRLASERPSPWRLTRASFDAPTGGDRPHLTHAEFPKDKPDGHGTVALTFTVDEKGDPKDLNASASDSPMERQLIGAVKKWRFRPATKDGSPIAVQATFEFEVARVF